MWDLPGSGLEPVSPALAGGFLTTAPPGKSQGGSFLLVGSGPEHFFTAALLTHLQKFQSEMSRLRPHHWCFTSTLALSGWAILTVSPWPESGLREGSSGWLIKWTALCLVLCAGNERGDVLEVTGEGLVQVQVLLQGLMSDVRPVGSE